MPLLIKIGALLSPVFAATWFVLAVMTYAGIATGSAEAAIAVENARLTHRDPIGLSIAIVVGLTAYGFWTERFWARYSALGFSVLTVALGVDGMFGGTATLRGVVEEVAITLIAWWYFFGKQTVVAYYAALQVVEHDA